MPVHGSSASELTAIRMQLAELLRRQSPPEGEATEDPTSAEDLDLLEDKLESALAHVKARKARAAPAPEEDEPEDDAG